MIHVYDCFHWKFENPGFTEMCCTVLSWITVYNTSCSIYFTCGIAMQYQATPNILLCCSPYLFTGFDIQSAESLATGLAIFQIYKPKTQLCSPAEISTRDLSDPLVVVSYFFIIAILRAYRKVFFCFQTLKMIVHNFYDLILSNFLLAHRLVS